MLEKLKVVLEFASSGLAGTVSTVKGLFTSILSGAKDAGKGLLDLAKNFFYVKEAVGALWGVATKLFDTFIRGAGEAAKMEAKLKNVTGSAESAAAVMALLDRVAKQTGADFNELAAGSSLLAVAAKDASGNFDLAKFTTLTDMLQRISALRPDVPIDRLARGLSTAVSKGDWSSLEMFLDVQLRQLIGIGEEAEKVGKAPGEIARGATYVETQTAGAANEALKSLDLLDQALTKAGATAGIVADVAELSGMERFNETLQSIARTVGEPLFKALNEGLSDLSDWLQENPELVDNLATSLGNLGALGIEKIFTAVSNLIANTDWEAFFNNATAFFEKLMTGDIEGAFEAIKMPELGEAFVGIAEALKTMTDLLIEFGKLFGKDTTKPETFGEATVQAVKTILPGGESVGDALKKSGWGQAIEGLGTIVKNLATDPGLVLSAIKEGLKSEPQEITVRVDMNTAMLNAQVTQTSENVTAQAFNRVSRNMTGEE